MRRKLALGVAAAIVGGTLTLGTAPAYACHNDIILSENPIHNWICGMVHETPVGEKLDQYSQEIAETVHTIYCTVQPTAPACTL